MPGARSTKLFALGYAKSELGPGTKRAKGASGMGGSAGGGVWYKARHPVESFFARLEQDCVIAMRCDKLARKFLDAIHMAVAIV